MSTVYHLIISWNFLILFYTLINISPNLSQITGRGFM
ncbi:putative integral membrane domain protein, partial [Acinetobacter baumannii 940793]